MIEFSPYAYEVHEDPYPLYARLRAEAPVYRNEELDFWALARHADVLAAFKDTKRFSNRFGVSIDPSSYGPRARLGTSFLAMDPPDHTRMRALVSRSFTPRRVAEMESRIREIAVWRLDRLVGAGSFDAVAEFAGKLPMDVISEMLGVPENDRSELRTWADLLVHREEGVMDVPPEGAEAFGKLIGYFRELISDRRKSPGRDLLSSLLELERAPNEDYLSESELLSICNLMIVAGNETTTKLIANALYWLGQNPAQRERVASGRVGMPQWVEETLRYDNSTQMLLRTLSEDSTIAGQLIPKDARILLLVGSANRDERVFERPDEYDLGRDCSRMLSFGQGTHFCLGAALARLEGAVSLEEWWRRFPDFQVDTSGIARVHSVNVRGFASLPVRV
ncbi:MAG TPA: cytochrome P450 [Myxococcales bacterium]|nr:cytochrome P450 [Myxococcales bacterium]